MEDTVTYGCPVCGFIAEIEDEIDLHMTDMSNDKKHQTFAHIHVDQDGDEDSE